MAAPQNLRRRAVLPGGPGNGISGGYEGGAAMPDDDMTPKGSISRRTALKGLAAGTAIAWTVPIVTTVESRAAAASNPVSQFICGTPGACGTFVACGSGGDCICAGNTAFGSLCVHGTTACADLVACNSDLTCADGVSLCVVDSCCGTPLCVPPSDWCAATGAAPRSAPTGSGPTLGSRAA